jgi:hypothetical protein
MVRASAPESPHEQACNERVTFAFRDAEPEVNSWLNLGDGRSTLSRNIKL